MESPPGSIDIEDVVGSMIRCRRTSVHRRNRLDVWSMLELDGRVRDDSIRSEVAGRSVARPIPGPDLERGRVVDVYEQIDYDVTDPVATITLNRPDALNAWTGQMGSEINDALARAEADRAVVGIVITGAGQIGRAHV